MGHWRKNHDSESGLLHHWDLLDEKNSRPGKLIYVSPIVTIERMTVERLKSRDNPKGHRRNVAHFRGKDKALGLNVTNCETLSALAGSEDPKDWEGLTIQLFVDQNAKLKSGSRGPAIRVAPKLPRAPADHGPFPLVSEEAREQLKQAHEERLGERESGEEGVRGR